VNPETYESSVDELAEMKKDLREKYPIIRAMKKIFSSVFQRDGREFMTLADMRFWRQGNPTLDATAKLNKLLDRVAVLVHFYHFIGDDEIQKYLKTKGIEISSDVQIVDQALNADIIDPVDWDDAMGEKSAGIPDRSQAVLMALLDRIDEVMKDIYNDKEKFTEKVSETSQAEHIRPGHVSRAAHLRFKQLMKKPVDGDLAKVRQETASAEQSISIFE
jgi:hypothetical protein